MNEERTGMMEIKGSNDGNKVIADSYGATTW
jgi:hypothetical protein